MSVDAGRDPRSPTTPIAEEGGNLPPAVCGIDIGGANLKLALPSGQTHARAFAMWREHQNLASTLELAIRDLSPRWPKDLAVTMTGELADCFETRRAGVAHILSELLRIHAAHRIHVYSTDGAWLTPDQAREKPWDVAASNWHALASWTARQSWSIAQTKSLSKYSIDTRHSSGKELQVKDSRVNAKSTNIFEHCLLVDIGSTTVDIIPFAHRRVQTDARTDRQRLQRGQLVYTGLERTAVAAITPSVMVAGNRCPVMAERFADSNDVYLILGLVEEQPDCRDTADGRTRTRQHALSRLARMVGEDSETLTVEQIESIASQIARAQAEQVAEAIRINCSSLIPTVAGPPSTVIWSGHGHAMVPNIKDCLSDLPLNFVELAETLGIEVSRCAPAFAVADLFLRSSGQELRIG